MFDKETMDALSSVKDCHANDWDDDSIETLILYCFVNIQIFKGSSQEEADKEWNTIAKQLSRTKESCQALFHRLLNKYLDIARTQIQDDDEVLDVTDVDWPYFDIFVKMCQYDGTNLTSHATKTVKTLQDVDLRLLQYYLKHKNLFKKAQFGGKIRLWSLIAGQMQMSPEECANRVNSIKYKYFSQFDNLPKEKYNVAENIHNASLYLLCSEIFTEDACENVNREENAMCHQLERVKKKMYTARKIKWQHSDIGSLLKFYSDNFRSLTTLGSPELFPKESWTPIAKELDRTETECYRKVCEFLKKHKKYAILKQQRPNSKVCCRYYNMIEDVFKSNKFLPDYLHNTNEGSQEVFDVSEEEYGSSEHYHGSTRSQNHQGISRTPTMPSNNVLLKDECYDIIKNDEDYICIVVAPQDEATEGVKNISTNKLIETNVELENNHETLLHNEEEKLHINTTTCRWSKRSKGRLLRLYKSYVMENRHQRIKEANLWISIASQMSRSPYHCRKAFLQMKTKYSQLQNGTHIKWPHFKQLKSIKRLKPLFTAEKLDIMELMTDVKPETEEIRDTYMNEGIVERMLSYYLENLEQFVNPKYYKMYVWKELGRAVGEDRSKCHRKFRYLSNLYNELKQKKTVDIGDWPYFNTFELITVKKNEIIKLLNNDQTLVEDEQMCEVLGFDLWDDGETEKLLEWFLGKADLFRNPKYIKKYLWREAELSLGLSADRCSKKIRDLRCIYRSHLKGLNDGNGTALDWKYFSMCSKIYGTDLKDPFLARTKRPRGYTSALNDSDQETTTRTRRKVMRK